MSIRDSDIRKHLLTELNSKRKPETIIKPEMQVGYGAAIIDIAVIENTFLGYEIKSEVDSLQRLKNQIETYDKLINKSYLVVCENHYKKAMMMIPDYWGIRVVTRTAQGIELQNIRVSSENPNKNTFALAQLLWRSEIIDLLTNIGEIKGLKQLPKFKLWHEICKHLDYKELEPIVINYLRQRDNWERPLKLVKKV